MTTGERIKKRRIELQISVDNLAEKIGVNRATIYRWENGGIESMSTDVLEPLAKALFTSPAALMGWDEDPAGSGSGANYRQIDQASNTNDPGSSSSGTASESLPGINLASTLHQPGINLSKAEQQLLGDFRELNSEGQEKVCEYASDLAASGRYIKARSETA